jgi:hypothetical protein
MTRRVLVAAVAVWLVAGASPTTQAPSDIVQLDVAVSDNNGPITDLRADEFQIQDDGKKVEIKTVTGVTANGMTKENGRTIFIILDDAGVPMAGTSAIQTIANLFASNAGPGDTLSVMSLHGTPDETPTQQLALSRIASFHAGSKPYFENETQEDMLQLMTRMSRQWQETLPGRRKAFVCIGSQGVCAILERESTAPRDKYPNWVNVLREMARTHAAAYAAIPARLDTTQGGYITDLTGGGTFSANSNFSSAVETVLRDLSQYYLVSYVAPKSSKQIRTLRVTVARKNMKVQVRTRR